MEKIEIKGQKKLSLQDSFLNQVRKTRSPVCIFLVNGIKLQGFVRSFDQYVVVLSNSSAPPKSFSEDDDPNIVKFRSDSDTQQMVYKHAISTIVPGNGDHRDKPRS